MHSKTTSKHRGSTHTCRLLCLISIATCTAFQKPTPFQLLARSPPPLSRRGNSNSRLFAYQNNNDNGNDEANLEKQFSQELKRRSASSAADISDSIETYAVSSSKEQPPSKPIRKFTGASSPLFTSNTNNAQSNNVQREREREFQLASRFENTFSIQAALILACAIFFLSVGFSGGITDGSDRNFYGDDDLIEDTVVEQLERIRTDDAAREVRGSYWL